MPIRLQCYINRKAENSVMNPEAYTPIVLLLDREAVPPFPRTWLIAGRIFRTLHTTLRVGSCTGTRLTQLASSVMNSGTYCPVVPWKPTNRSTLSITVDVGDVGWGNHESSGHENLSPWMWEIYGERAVARSGDLSLKCPWPHFEPPDHLPP